MPRSSPPSTWKETLRRSGTRLAGGDVADAVGDEDGALDRDRRRRAGGGAAGQHVADAVDGGEGVEPLPPAVDQLLEGQEQPRAEHGGGDDDAGGDLVVDDEVRRRRRRWRSAGRCAGPWRRRSAPWRPPGRARRCRAPAPGCGASGGRRPGSIPIATMTSALRIAAAVSAWMLPFGARCARAVGPADGELGGDAGDERGARRRRGRSCRRADAAGRGRRGRAA